MPCGCFAMAAEAAEGKLTEYLRSEIGKLERDCIRPLQVNELVCMHGSVEEF